MRYVEFRDAIYRELRRIPGGLTCGSSGRCSIRRPEVARLYHITSAAEAREAGKTGVYEPAAFAREGFIHCSYAYQVAATANRIFRGRPDLVLLEIDPAGLDCPVVDENLEGGVELFPHIYGRLNMSAVIRVRDFPCDSAGEFRPTLTLPE